MNKFAEWIQKKLDERDWTQSDLARATGLTRQAINYYLSNKSKSPDEDSLMRLSRAFQVSPEEVFRAAGLLPAKPETDEEIDAIVMELVKMSPVDKKRVYETIKLWNSIAEGSKARATKTNKV